MGKNPARERATTITVEHAEREEDEPPGCTAGAIRFSGVYIRTALQRADWQGVHRVQSIEEEREQDEAECGGASDAWQ